MYTRKTEIRHLSPTDVRKLATMLDQTHSWKKLMRMIPKNLSTIGAQGGKYNSDHMRLIENAANNSVYNRLPGEILFDEWGTSGRQRPNLENLLQLLITAELFKAADFVAVDLLKESPPERPASGPAARVDISLPLLETDEAIENKLMDFSYPGSENIGLGHNIERLSNNLNHVDLQSKYQTHKEIDIVFSNLIKFSSNSVEEEAKCKQTASESNNISNIPTGSLPKISALLNNPQRPQDEQQHLQSIDNQELSSTNIPNISALMLNAQEEIPEESNDSAGMFDQLALPNLSMLNNDLSSSPHDSINSVSSTSTCDESSLTNVSTTTAENSFSEDTQTTQMHNLKEEPSPHRLLANNSSGDVFFGGIQAKIPEAVPEIPEIEDYQEQPNSILQVGENFIISSDALHELPNFSILNQNPKHSTNDANQFNIPNLSGLQLAESNEESHIDSSGNASEIGSLLPNLSILNDKKDQISNA